MKPFDRPIYVTRPHLPPLGEYAHRLEEVWTNAWLTNRGPVHQRFVRKLAERFQTANVSLFTNGTLALQIGLQGMGLTGEVITTPFTFAASTNALVQTGLKPVFVDVEPVHFTIDPDRIEAAITPATSAILAVHVFGFPCQLERLSEIAARRGLKLIYDSAHAFGVTVDGVSIARFGDLSMFSFHATKPFHAVEGGALTFNQPGLKAIFDTISNHGLTPEGDVAEPGTNGKMTELQAVMGEMMLERIDGLTRHTAEIESIYRHRLGDIPGIDIPARPPAGVVSNHAFAPILVDARNFGLGRDDLHDRLFALNVLTRRYFCPLITNMTAYAGERVDGPLDRANAVADRVLALPIYADLALSDVHRICDMVAEIQKRATAVPRTRSAELT